MPESENLFVIGRKLLDDKKYTEAVKSIYDGVEFWHVEKDSKSDWNHVLYCVQSDKFLGMVLNVCTHKLCDIIYFHHFSIIQMINPLKKSGRMWHLV